jgi:hypothetical protein
MNSNAMAQFAKAQGEAVPAPMMMELSERA